MKKLFSVIIAIITAAALHAQCQVLTTDQVKKVVIAGSLQKKTALLEQNGFIKVPAYSNAQADVFRKCPKYEGKAEEHYVETFYLGKGADKNQVLYEVWDMKQISSLKSQIMKPGAEMKKDTLVMYRWGDSINVTIKKLPTPNSEMILSHYQFSFLYQVPVKTNPISVQDLKAIVSADYESRQALIQKKGFYKESESSDAVFFGRNTKDSATFCQATTEQFGFAIANKGFTQFRVFDKQLYETYLSAIKAETTQKTDNQGNVYYEWGPDLIVRTEIITVPSKICGLDTEYRIYFLYEKH